MLKDIGERPEPTGVISSCKRISAWLHNHGQLNVMMRKAIGGELVKWNATRFGTNYMFLDSIYQRRQGFMQWMASPEFQNSKWAHTEEGRFAHFRLSNMDWWDGLKYIIDTVQPVYKLLRFAGREKKPNLCDVVYQYQLCKHEMESFFGNNVSMWKQSGRDPKRQKGKTKAPAKQVTSDASTDDDDGQRSPSYQESGIAAQLKMTVMMMVMVAVVVVMVVVVVVVEFVSQVYTRTFTHMYDVSNYMY
jgi:hypothetical protein